MKKCKKYYYNFLRFFFSKLPNIVVLILSIVGLAGVTILWKYICALISVIINNPIVASSIAACAIIIIMVIANIFFFEKSEKIRLNGSDKNWIVFEALEDKIVLPREGGTFLSGHNAPYILKRSLKSNYAIEFKVKVINECFSWLINCKIDMAQQSPNNALGYMFQYNPQKKQLRPHLLKGTLFYLPKPEDPNAFFETVGDLVLTEKNGWYNIRTELFDGGKYIRIVIYDMNDFARLVKTYYFDREDHILRGDSIGFRNQYAESAIYKDLKIIDFFE
jgi:hypothetical protein